MKTAVLLLAALTIVVQGSTSYEITKLNNPNGVYFEKIGPMTEVEGYEYITKRCNLSEILEAMTKVMSTRDNQDNHYLNNLYVHLLGKLSNLMNHNNRKKRELIDGLGTVIKFITGNTDANDLKHIQKSIKLLQNNEISIYQNINETINKIDIRLSSIRRDLRKLYEISYTNKVNLDILISFIIFEDIVNMLELGITLAKPRIAYRDIFDSINEDEVDSILVYTAQNVIHFVAKVAILKLRGNAYNIIPFPNPDGQILEVQFPIILIKDAWYAYPNTAQCKKKEKSLMCYQIWWKDRSKTPDCIHQALYTKNNHTCTTTKLLEDESIETIDNGIFLLFSKNIQRVKIICNETHYEIIKGPYKLQLEPGCELIMASLHTKVILKSASLYKEEIQQIQMHLKERQTTYRNTEEWEALKLKPLKEDNSITHHVWIPSIWTVITMTLIICGVCYIYYRSRCRNQERNNGEESPGITSYTLSSLLRGEESRTQTSQLVKE
nr:uncharacterized protein LOC117995420 [Maniola hyperantus]